MQTSSNFFNKSLLTDDNLSCHKKKYKNYESHIVSDPLMLKQQLTPWTQINPKYNINTQRLIKFKQKLNQQPQDEQIEQESKEERQVKGDAVSNLFNFYKNNKEKKRSTHNGIKRKRKNSLHKQQELDKGWTLPPITVKEELQECLIESNESKDKNISSKKQQQKHNQSSNINENTNINSIPKPKGPTYIESISIRQYLSKLKEKQRVFSSSRDVQKSTSKDINEKDQFTSNRFTKQKSKNQLRNSISLIRQTKQADATYRYAPIRNPETYSQKKRSNISHFQSLEQSFQIYKRAAQMEVHDNLGVRKKFDNNQKAINFTLAQRNLFKSNVPLSSLFSSSNSGTTKTSTIKNETCSPLKKYNTISYDKSVSSSQGQNSLILPKVSKNYSYQK